MGGRARWLDAVGRADRLGRTGTDELLALCAAVGDHEGTFLEGAFQGGLDTFSDEEIDLVAAMTAAPPCVILVEPQLAENIGAVARVMANFGLSDLRLVRPRDGWPQERAWASASRSA